MRTNAGDIYGAKLPDGTIYLNPSTMNANTPTHEFAHLWQQLMPKQFANGVELLKRTKKGKELFDSIKNNDGYANKDDGQIWNEALVTLIGNEGERLFHSPVKTKIGDWIKQFFRALGNRIGFKNLAPEMKLQTFVKAALSEINGVNNLIPESSIENAEAPIYIKHMSNARVEQLLWNLGVVERATCPT